MKKGKLNLISDVTGVKVGHKTLSDGDIQTGVTIIKPSNDNIFQNKLVAASCVLNGFGKTSGLVQIDELGTLESYIGLTNTLSVGTVQQALVKQMVKENEDIGTTTGTVNAVVGECNDGYLNDIRGCHVSQQDVFDALGDCKEEFELGSVGAGRGMSCFQMKGGIGSSSRVIELDNQEYTVGALVLSNFGLKKNFIIDTIEQPDLEELEKGSIIMVIATDIPMSDRQLKRVCKRMPVALARTGSHMGNGSGDIAIAFSTGNVISHYQEDSFLQIKCVHEDKMDYIFDAAIEACQEAIMSSLYHNQTVQGRDGNVRLSLADSMKAVIEK